jgi:hypothetical protein
MTGKGHVPEENLARYRRLVDIAHTIGVSAGRLSGHGYYDDANKLWAMEAKYMSIANELRADLPEPPLTEEK